MIGHHQRLAVAFGLVVNRAGTDWVHMAPVVLRLRMLKRVAVTLRCGGVKMSGAISGCDFESVLCAYGAHAQSLQPQAKILGRTGRGSEIEDVVHRSHIEGLADIPLLEAEARFLG